MSQLEPFWTDKDLPPSRNQRSWLRRIVAVLVVVAILILGWNGYGIIKSLGSVADYDGQGTGSVTVTVARGDSLTAIAGTLVDAGVVKSKDAFLRAADGNDAAATIGPGQYELHQEMSGESALALMLDPASRAANRLVLPEGLTLAESVTTASKASGLPKKDFTAVLDEPSSLPLPGWAKGRPEGMLFPASYDLAGDETASTILQQLVKRFDQASTDLDLEARAKTLGRTPYDVLTVASIVQMESTPNDFAKVARVIYNRLDAGMPLQLDSTVAYGLGVSVLQLSAKQLKTDTPYNTYLHEGLPPTPINSPGEAAIEAALSPAQGKWLYFVTVDPKTGETKFTKNYETFLKWKAEFNKNVTSP